MLRGIILGLLLGVLLVFVGAYLYFASGQAPVSTASPPMPFEEKFAGMALDAYLARQPHLNPPIPADEANYIEGAKIYKEHCAMCHGLPGQPKTPFAEGMFPNPPQLFQGVGMTDDEPWQIYATVAGGIRMSGMPGFKKHLNDTETWQVSLLLKNADKLPDPVKAELLKPEEEAPAGAGKDEHEHHHHH